MLVLASMVGLRDPSMRWCGHTPHKAPLGVLSSRPAIETLSLSKADTG